MLRNRGVNVTERRIRQDVLRAYEYDIFDARPRYRLHEACQTNYHRQPRYCTARCARPHYFHTASSFTSYGVKRVYMPEDEWGTGSAESSVYVRYPRYNMRSYYPNEIYHFNGERPYRSDVRYEGYYSRRPSSVYIDDDDYYPHWQSRHTYTDRRLVRKVTRKLSPIFTCDCATRPNVKQPKKNNNSKNKTQHNDLSKEAQELSLDIFKIISLLQKADGEDEEDPSSVSLLQNVQNLDCRSSKSFAKVITQRVNVCQKMERPKQNDPLTKFKIASGVRSKLEAIVDALKQYEAEKSLDTADSSNYEPKYRNIIPSDPPSLEVRSFSNGKDLKSSTNVDTGKQKDIVSQTEQPKMSNKSVYGKVKVKKGDSNAERKSLRSRISWRKKESSGIKVRRDSGNERFTDKKTERKRSFFCKTKSKTRIRSILESEHSQSEKNFATKQGQPNKAGLMIKIGGSPQRKKSKSPEKHKEKPPKPWIKKFLDDKNNNKNNIRVRYNNKGFYAKSSSTIFELVSNVYKQMGINNSKSDETSTPKHKKAPKKTTHKPSKTRMHKSSIKPKYKHKVEAYMIPEIIVPGPVYRPNVNNEGIENLIRKPHGITPNFYNRLNTTSGLSINYFEIKLSKNFFDRSSTSEESTSGKHEYKTVEYKATKSDAFEDTLNTIDYFDKKSVLNESGVDASEDEHSEDATQVSNISCFPKSEDTTAIGLESEPTKSRIDMQKLETEPQLLSKSGCSLAKKILNDEFLNWMPIGSESLIWSGNYDDLDKISIIHDDISIKSDIENASESTNDVDTQNSVSNTVTPKVSKEGNKRKMFSALNENFVQWKNRAKGTLSESIVGINSRKSVALSVFWNLIKLVRKDHSHKSNTTLPRQDLSLVQPPGIVSQPECSYKFRNQYLTRKPLRSQKLPVSYNPLRLSQLASAALEGKKELDPIIPSLIRKSLCSMKFGDVAEHEIEVEKSQNISPTVSLTETAEDKELMLTDAAEPINAESVQVAIPDESNLEQDKSSKSRKPLCQIRLVRSVHTNLKMESDIKLKVVRSVLIHSYQIHQNSQVLLFALPIFGGLAKIRQFNCYKQSEKTQPPNLPECLSEPSQCEQNLKLKSVHNNKVFKETASSSRHIIRNENFNDNVEEKVLSNNNKTDTLQVFMKQMNSERNELQNFDNCYERASQNKISDIEPNKTKQSVLLNKKHKIENNSFPSDIPCVLDKKPAMQFSVEVTKGNTITKIFIRKCRSSKGNNLKSTNLKMVQHPASNDSEPTKQPEKKVLRKKVKKVCINIINMNASDTNLNGKNLLNKSETDHIFQNQLPQKEVNEYQAVAKRNTDLNNSNDDAEDNHRWPTYKSSSLQPFTKCLHIDDINGVNDGTKSSSKRILFYNEYNDTCAIKSSLDNCMYDKAAEEYVNEILGTKDKVDNTKLKKVVDMRRTFNAMTTLNVSAFAEMALMRELASDHNDTYTSLRQQLKRRKKIVSILSEINMRNITTDYLRQKAKTDNLFDNSGTNESCSLCNILARKLNSHRCVEIAMPANFNLSGDIAANCYFHNLVSPAMPNAYEFEDLVSPLKEHMFSNSDTLINIENVEIGDMLMESILHSSKKYDEEKIHEAKPVCWCCVKNMNKKSKKNQTKKWERKNHTKRVSNYCQKDAIILVNTDFANSQNSSFTEYKVRFSNGDPTIIDDSDAKLFSGGNKSDILQSYKIKKAVLQIYSDKTVEDDGYIVAKIPKYLRL